MERKEAIQIVKNNWPNDRHMLSEALEVLIPELKESGDERIRKRIIQAFHGDVLEMNEIKEAVAWLEKQGEHKADEIYLTKWSEEDEAMYQGVIETKQYMLDVVYGRRIFDVGNEDIKEGCAKELAWLKSIRPQKWKPSDEQMNALHDINLTGCISYAGQGQLLIDLYNDLKKIIKTTLNYEH